MDEHVHKCIYVIRQYPRPFEHLSGGIVCVFIEKALCLCSRSNSFVALVVSPYSHGFACSMCGACAGRQCPGAHPKWDGKTIRIVTKFAVRTELVNTTRCDVANISFAVRSTRKKRPAPFANGLEWTQFDAMPIESVVNEYSLTKLRLHPYWTISHPF